MRNLLVFALLAAFMAPAALASDTEMKPLDIELPKPNFGGTPLDYWGDNLEPRSFKDRDPFLAPAGTTNVAQGKEVTAGADPLLGTLDMVVDGEKEYQDKNVVELPADRQYVQIDLGAVHDVYAILLWHYHANERVYFDVAVQTALDADFTKGVETIFNNDHDNSSNAGVGEDMEYIEDYRGKLIDVGGVQARYVRLYSNGNTSDEKNHYVEVEVYGKPAE